MTDGDQFDRYVSPNVPNLTKQQEIPSISTPKKNQKVTQNSKKSQKKKLSEQVIPTAKMRQLVVVRRICCCVSALDFSLRAAWAGREANGREKS